MATMSLPQTYKAFRRSSGDLPTTLELVEEKMPSSLNPQEVLIRIHAVSLNYRDVAMMNGLYPVEVIDEGIPASDCAAEVVAVGSEVQSFKIGDHVTTIFDLSNLNGTEDILSVLGGDVDGVLREFAVFDQNVLLHLPQHLSWEEVCIVETRIIEPLVIYMLIPFFNRRRVLPVLEPLHGMHWICLAQVAPRYSKVNFPTLSTLLQANIDCNQKVPEESACLVYLFA